MRILIVSNIYPPYYIGGYELGCHDVATNLRARGHEVRVLTSTYGIDCPTTDEWVCRWLQILFDSNPTWGAVVVKEAVNQCALRQLIKDFRPNVLFLWNLRHASMSHVALAREVGLPTCSYIFDDWLSCWKNDHWYEAYHRHGRSRIFRLLNLVPPPNNLEGIQPIFASKYLKTLTEDAGSAPTNAPVLHFGIDPEKFPYKAAYSGEREPKLLYVGQLVEKKGAHTVVDAFCLFRRQLPDVSLTLTIVGNTNQCPEYVARLKLRAAAAQIHNNIQFVGSVPREELPKVYASHDILIFPSIWDEPFGITPLEAMSCGLAVVATASGGSAEFLQDEVNALTFPKGDHDACARQIRRLIDDPYLLQRIRAAGRNTVDKQLRLDRTIDALERVITGVAGAVNETSKLRPRYNSVKDNVKVLQRTMRRANRWVKLKNVYNRAEKYFMTYLPDGRSTERDGL